MSSSTSGRDDDAPELVCQIDCVHGMVDALSSIRWKRHQAAQDAAMELSAHGIVLTVQESGCLQAKVFLKRELFVEYDYAGEGRERFGLSLGSSSTASTSSRRRGTHPLSRSGTLAPICSFSSNQWTSHMHVCMQKSEQEFRVQSPGITILSITGILQSLSL